MSAEPANDPSHKIEKVEVEVNSAQLEKSSSDFIPSPAEGGPTQNSNLSEEGNAGASSQNISNKNVVASEDQPKPPAASTSLKSDNQSPHRKSANTPSESRRNSTSSSSNPSSHAPNTSKRVVSGNGLTPATPAPRRKSTFVPPVAPAVEALVKALADLIPIMRIEASRDETLQTKSQNEVEASILRLPTRKHRSALCLTMNRYSAFCATPQLDVPAFPITATKVALFLARATDCLLGQTARQAVPQSETFPLPIANGVQAPSSNGANIAVMGKYEGDYVTRELVVSWAEALGYAQLATRTVWQDVPDPTRTTPTGEDQRFLRPLLNEPVVQEILKCFEPLEMFSEPPITSDESKERKKRPSMEPADPNENPQKRTKWVKGGKTVNPPRGNESASPPSRHQIPKDMARGFPPMPWSGSYPMSPGGLKSFGYPTLQSPMGAGPMFYSYRHDPSHAAHHHKDKDKEEAPKSAGEKKSTKDLPQLQVNFSESPMMGMGIMSPITGMMPPREMDPRMAHFYGMDMMRYSPVEPMGRRVWHDSKGEEDSRKPKEDSGENNEKNEEKKGSISDKEDKGKPEPSSAEKRREAMRRVSEPHFPQGMMSRQMMLRNSALGYPMSPVGAPVSPFTAMPMSAGGFSMAMHGDAYAAGHEEEYGPGMFHGGMSMYHPNPMWGPAYMGYVNGDDGRPMPSPRR